MNQQGSLRLAGLKQVLYEKRSGDRFTVLVEGEMTVQSGQFAAILGPSGCGKTTLLTVLGLLRWSTPDSRLTEYTAWFRNDPEPTDLAALWRTADAGRSTQIRRQHFGFALQSGELIPALSVEENLLVPLELNGYSKTAARHRVDELIEGFQMQSFRRKRLSGISGGQYQRASLARSVAHQPEFLFVDEPTASLNRELARSALQQLRQQTTASSECGIVMITHDSELAREFCDVIFVMEAAKDAPTGRLVGAFSPKDIESNRTAEHLPC